MRVVPNLLRFLALSAAVLAAPSALAAPPRGGHELVKDFYSHALNNRRDIHIYTPPGYDPKGTQRYPVVYMHDGQNLFGDWESKSPSGVGWNVAGAIERGMEEGTLRPAIVVAIHNTPNRMWEYTPSEGGHGGGGADRYLEFLINELKPAVDRTLMTLPGPEHTAIVGSSLGGLVSAYAGLKRPDVFGLVGALSPSSWWDGQRLRRLVLQSRGGPRNRKVYLDSGDSGTDDDDVRNTRKLAGSYRRVGQSLHYEVQAGASHSEVFWAQRIQGALTALLGKE